MLLEKKGHWQEIVSTLYYQTIVLYNSIEALCSPSLILFSLSNLYHFQQISILSANFLARIGALGMLMYACLSDHDS